MAANKEMLGSFELTTPLSNQNSGFSVWGFARREGNDYFVKQFLSPIYPEDDKVSSPERIQKKIRQCRKFEQEKIELYRALNNNSDGNAMRVQEFFRVGSHYYIATKKLTGPPLEIETIAKMKLETKRTLCATIAHAIASFHKGGLVHADLKHTNIMYIHSRSGNLTAKVIDFDSSFLESHPPQPGDEIVGDQIYFSPEACRSIWGEEVPLTCKMDVFAMGVLFHQYITGELPYHSDEFFYPGEAVANGSSLKLSDAIPEEYRELLTQMLDADPEKRPTAHQVFLRFSNMPETVAATAKPVSEVRREPAWASPSPGGSPFFTPGDL